MTLSSGMWRLAVKVWHIKIAMVGMSRLSFKLKWQAKQPTYQRDNMQTHANLLETIETVQDTI